MVELSLRSSSYGASLGHAFGSLHSASYSGASIGHVYDYMSANGTNLTLAGFRRTWDKFQNIFIENTSYGFLLSEMTKCSANCIVRVSANDHYYYQNPQPTSGVARDLGLETWKNSLDGNDGAVDNCYQDKPSGFEANPHVFGALTIVDDFGRFRGWVDIEDSMTTIPNAYMGVGWFSTDAVIP